MTPTIFIAVLLAAALHATWNAFAKSANDKITGMTAIAIGGIPPAVIILAIAPTPNPDAIPWLIGSMVIHIAYQIALIQSYKIGEYTLVYPIARGSAPVWVVGVSIIALDTQLTIKHIIAIALVCAAILMLAVNQNNKNTKAIIAALITGGLIATYSILDGLGARAAQTAFGYLAWMHIIDGIVLLVGVRAVKPNIIKDVFQYEQKAFWIGGTASVVAYGIVIWAMLYAPIAIVVALREVSVIFALAIGVVFLKEKLNIIKIVAVIVALAGVVMLRMTP